MKIRIKGNSIRLRLTQTEIATIATEGCVSEMISFGSSIFQKLTYTLKVGNIENLTAKYYSNEIEIMIPREKAKLWTSTDLVSLEELMSISEEETLRILVEKDFKCLKPRTHEDETDHYPHPNEHEMVC